MYLRRLVHACSMYTLVPGLTCSSEGLVDGTDVDPTLRLLPVGGGNQPHDRHVRVQLLWFRFSQFKDVHVPASALQEETPDVAAVLRPFCQLRGALSHHLGA